MFGVDIKFALNFMAQNSTKENTLTHTNWFCSLPFGEFIFTYYSVHNINRMKERLVVNWYKNVHYSNTV